VVAGGDLPGTTRARSLSRPWAAHEPRFLDTNILVYVFDRDEPAKQARATHLFQGLAEQGTALLSTQVLQQFYVVATGRLRSPLTLAEAATALEAFARLPVVTITPGIVPDAARLHRSASVSFWDTLIIQAALSGGADVLYSEDLQHGRRFGGLRIENPFLAEQPIDAAEGAPAP